MSWARWYAIKSYVMSTMWIAPVVAILAEQLFFRVTYATRFELGWVPGFTFGREGAIAAADYVIGSSIAFIVFTFSSLVVAIQVASGQLTPRIIATLLRNRPIRISVGAFVFALLLAVAVKSRVDDIPHFLVSVMAILGLVDVLVFMFLIDYAARLLRPVSMLRRIAEQGLKVIESVYPQLAKAPGPAFAAERLEGPELRVAHRGTSAVIIAINTRALVALARRADCSIELLPRVGDFVASGEPLFSVRGPGAQWVNERKMRSQVAFGEERTIEQDAAFAFRVVVDIALKALSKAINDPTTAVLAIDQLQRLLRSVGQRRLTDGRVCDESGRIRLIIRTPNWEDFVQLALTEIRCAGVENIQVVRRLRAMIDAVTGGVHETRRPALREQLALLDRAIERVHPFREDVALCRLPDSQGLGGFSYPEGDAPRAATG
jgi:uncharacterized membrane protein